MAADFKAGQLRSGLQGPKGDPGPQGPKGDAGAPGATKVVQRSTNGPTVGAGGYTSAEATCQPGESLVGGGARGFMTLPAQPTLVTSGPSSASAWYATFRNDGAGGTVYARAYALCATP